MSSDLRWYYNVGNSCIECNLELHENQKNGKRKMFIPKLESLIDQ